METFMETAVENGAPIPTRRGKSEGSRKTQFRPGHPGRKGGGRVKEEGPSRLLRDYRRVYEQDESKDRTPGQKALRQLLKESPRDFLSQLSSLEKAHRSSPARSRFVELAEPEDPHEDVAECIALVEQLIQGHLARQEAGRKSGA
jgi:hypothetical protein